MEGNKNIKNDPQQKQAIDNDFQQRCGELFTKGAVEKSSHTQRYPHIDSQAMLRREDRTVTTTIIVLLKIEDTKIQ